MFKKMFNMSKEATQSKFDNLWSNSLTAWAYSTCTQVPQSSIQIYRSSAFKILFKKLLKSKITAAFFYVWVNHFKINYKIVLKEVTCI